MSAVSDLRAGDRVRVTFEGIVGRKHGVTGVDIAEHRTLFDFLQHAISIEVIAPAPPDWSEREGTVVLDRDGLAWQFSERWNAYRAVASESIVTYAYPRLVKCFGPLTLLHDPGAEVVAGVDNAPQVPCPECAS